MDRNNSFVSDLSLSRSGSLYSLASSASGIELPLNKKAFESDFSCNCCGSAFTSGGLVRSCCTFCYRGVCWNCFTKQATHPESQENSQICDGCFDRILNKGVNQLEKLRSDIYELKEKFEHEKRTTLKEAGIKKELEDELEALIAKEKQKENSSLKEIQALREQNSKLEQNIKILQLECAEKESISKNYEQKIKAIQEEAEVLKVKYHNANTYESVKNALEKAKEEFEELQKESKSNEVKDEGGKAEELELEINRDQLRQQLENALEVYEELKNKVAEIENSEEEQKQHLETLHKSMSVMNNKESSFIEIPKNRFMIEFNELSKQLNERQERIDRLKSEIRKKSQKSVNNSDIV